MDDEQQFSLRWHNHQNSVIGALGRMLSSGALTDVTLSASGATLKAHRLVLASCSQYFAQLFKEVEAENNTLVVVLSCDETELRHLLTFMYTGEVTASKKSLPSLLRLAQTLKVSGLTDADNNSTLTSAQSDIVQESSPSPVNLQLKPEEADSEPTKIFDDSSYETKDYTTDFMANSEKERLSKLDQIVQNLYSTHKFGSPVCSSVSSPTTPNLGEPPTYSQKWRSSSSVCSICNKVLSNQYNLRVHMETHAGRRHACRACSHVSRSKDALRKHVAYRHAGVGRERRDL